MNQKKRNLLIFAFIFIFIFAVFILTFLSQRVKMNDRNIPGNTAGNLNNGGLFCESEGVVYFSNAYDSGCLYSMNPDETNMKKLTTACVSSINADSNYLYYYLDSADSGVGLGYVQRTYGIFRSKRNGKRAECLKRGNAITLQLCGNYIYYQYFDNDSKKGTQLFKVKIDKSEEKRIADYNINPASFHDGQIYFNGTKDNHYLYSLNTANDSISLLWEGNIWNPVYDNGYIYFMDMSNNYRLCRYSPSENVVEVLTNDRIDFFNVYGSYIYYQKSSQTEPAFKRMYTDGSNVETIAEGVYKNINITSAYVYFTAFENDVPVYKTPTNGAIRVTTFENAMQAAARELK